MTDLPPSMQSILDGYAGIVARHRGISADVAKRIVLPILEKDAADAFQTAIDQTMDRGTAFGKPWFEVEWVPPPPLGPATSLIAIKTAMD